MLAAYWGGRSRVASGGRSRVASGGRAGQGDGFAPRSKPLVLSGDTAHKKLTKYFPSEEGILPLEGRWSRGG